MSQATGYCTASDDVPFVVPVRFATPVVFPLLQPSSSFKRGGQETHPSMSGQPETHSGVRAAATATTTTSMSRQHHPVVDPLPPDRESVRLRSGPSPACSGDVQPASRRPAKKSHARKQPEGHIPRPRNAFILFRCDFVAQKKIPASVEPDHRNISRIVGRIWKAMSEEDRRPWVEEAKKEREMHKMLYPQYRYSPSATVTATGTTGTTTKRAQSKKMRENMGVLPVWEVARQSPSPGSAAQTRCDRPSEPTQEPQRREGPSPREEALPQPRAQTIVPDGSWGSVPDSRGETLFNDQSLSSADWEHQSWEFAGAEPQHHLPRDRVAAAVGSFPGLNTPSPLREMAAPFETLATSSFHFDSPDPGPSPVETTLSPFMFVARHYATNNAGFSGFHFAPTNPGEAPAAALPFADALVGTDPALAGQLEHQQHPALASHKTGPENLLESFAWTTEQIDGIIRNMQRQQSGPSSLPSFDFVEPLTQIIDSSVGARTQPERYLYF